MSYLVYARKYRPQTFSDVVGQEHITRILEKAVSDGNPRHAYLFCGSRGTGKTTCARILAKELNVRVGEKSSSLDLGLQSSLDIIEIDGASNNGVDDVRVLRENVRLVPLSGGYKVYIIDEVHMLSASAFNALLKTLEEPPEHVVFIFATTEPGKLPATVLSRCQRFDFKRIPVEKIKAYLREICLKEGVSADDDALAAIARNAQGGMRDALSVLDQISALGGNITLSKINELFGLVEAEQLSCFLKALVAKDVHECMRIIDRIMENGKDIRNFSSDLIQYFRHIMLFKVGGKDLEGLVDLPKVQKEEINLFASTQTMTWIVRSLEIVIQSQDTARIINDARLALELALVKIAMDSPGVISSGNEKKQTAIPVVPVKPVVGTFLKNNKGVLTLAPLEVFSDKAQKDSVISLDVLREKWNELVFAASQKKISVGTYLQSGIPFQVSGNTVIIAFSPEDVFNKECLEAIENQAFLAGVFSDMLGVKVVVNFIVAEFQPAQKAPAVDEAVSMFDGEVVNEWINDE